MDRLARRPNSGDATAGRTPPHRSGYPGTREEAIGYTEKPAIEVIAGRITPPFPAET
jgi:hypothetical protein